MLEQKDEQLLIDLTSARGVPGNEEEVREVFKAYAKDYADEIIFDGLPNTVKMKIVHVSLFQDIWMKLALWLPKLRKKASSNFKH